MLRVAGERNGLLGGVRARTRDHRHATFRLFDTTTTWCALVSASDFAGRPDGDEAIRALGDLPVYKSAKSLLD